MKKSVKILINIAVFLVIVCFIWYMIRTINSNETTNSVSITEKQNESPFKQVKISEVPDEISSFELYDGKLFIVAANSVFIFDIEGEQPLSFPIKQNVRDITVRNKEIYILYPTAIEVYNFNGDLLHDWEACSDLSDYCSFAVVNDYLFVTDADNKNICKYTKEGRFIKFIKSPAGFIIPSYAFDISSWNDTVYCVNSGRHSIETYTVDGDFIISFGSFGNEPGFFAGCCNPVFISFTPFGKLLTSEKGNPRVCLFERNGKFSGLLFDNEMFNAGNFARQVKMTENKLFISENNKISVFHLPIRIDSQINHLE